MEALIVGEGELGLHEVATVIKNSTSFPVLLNKWVSWSRCLGINEAEITGLNRKINLGTIELQDVPREIFNIWKADKGSKATLKALCKALKESGVQDIAEALSDKFWGKSDKYLVNRRLYTLEQLVGSSASESFHGFSKRIKLNRKNTPIALIRDQLSPQESPEYYISRSFLFRSELDVKIFKDESTKKHIFVLKGATKSEVARVCGLEMIDSSRNQLDKITVRFILLDCIEDFGKICEITSRPVHMIKYENEKFLWIQSTQSWEVIQNFLKKSDVRVDEVDVIKKITSPCSALSIADSPGMGKTFVLVNLAKKTEETHPKAVVFFIVLQEFVRQIHLLAGSSPLDIILRYVSTNYTTKSILQKMLENNAFHFLLFLDGYDEVLQDKLHLVDSYLQELVKLKNIRVIITTRPHLKSRLEGILNSFSFEILPFDGSNQIEFLTKYWTTNHGAVEGNSLIEFAKKCLNKLKTIMTDTERLIAGIPLQCMMLAEVYAEDAKRASEHKELPEDAVKIYSFFQMYKALIDFKLSKISDPLARQKYLDAHIYESLALLFPEWLEKFQPYLSPRNDMDENTLYSIGLLEKIPFSDESRFVHRTFAEYLLADFVTRDLKRSSFFVDFLVKQILGEMDNDDDNDNDNKVALQLPSLCKLKHPVIAYFINMHLQERYFRSSGLPEFPITMDLQNITEDVCIAAAVCCCNDLESFFDLTSSIIKRLGISKNFELQDKYIKYLPHLVVKWTSNPTFVRNVLNFTKSEFKMNLNYYVYQRQFGYNLVIPYCTPLHMALYNGNYNIVMCILQECGTEVLSIKHLLHACVYDTAKTARYRGESVYEEKLSIMEALIKLKKECLEEELEGRTPLLQDGVDFKIAKKLVELGANINAYSPKYKTVLHTIMNTGHREYQYDLNYSNVLQWALNHGFEVNHKDRWGRTALMSTIQYCSGENHDRDESFQMFNEAKSDFNAEDEFGESVLFYAIRYSRRISVIEEVLYYGANPNHKNRKGMNAAHVLMDEYENYVLNVVQVLESLKSGGFDKWDQTDNNGHTPLMLATKKRIHDDDEEENLHLQKFTKFLHEQGVNFNAEDHGGNSVLFYAIKKLDIGSVQKILDFGANPNHKNKKGQTVADIVTYKYKHDPTKMQRMLELLVSKGFDGFNHSVSSTRDINQIIATCKQKLNFFFKTAAKTIDENGDTILFHAIRYSYNLEVVCNILEQGCEVNHQNNLGENAAHYYMNYKLSHVSKTLEFLKLLKSHGFTGLDQKDNEGCTPLMIAMIKFSLYAIDLDEFLHFFSEEGADFNAQDNDGRSVLLKAIDYFGNPDFIPDLVRSSLVADVLVKLALEKRNDDDKLRRRIRSILEFGANPNHKMKCGTNAAHLVMSCYSNDPVQAVKLLKLLKSKGFDGFNEKDEDGCTPIMKAIKFNKVVGDEILKFLTEVGVDFNAQDNDGRSVLFYAIQYSQNPDFIRKMLDIGANPNHRMKCGGNTTHLVLECYSNDPVLAVKVLTLLKSKGFDGFNEKDEYEDTPIMHAIRFNKVVGDEVLHFLTEQGVDFNAQEKNGHSVLFYAIKFSKNPDFIKKILDFGANPNHRKEFGRNAAHLVLDCYSNDPDLAVKVLKLLKSKGFDGFNEKDEYGLTPIMHAIRFNKVVGDEVLHFLTEQGVDFNAQEKNGHSVLFYAIEFSKNPDFIQKILAFGANPNQTNEFGRNASHLVLDCYSNDPDLAVKVFKLLKSKGFVGFNEKDEVGCPPIVHAIRFNKVVGDELLQFLADVGVDFNAQDNNGNSVLFYALEFSKNLDFIQKILILGACPNHVNAIGNNAAHLVMRRYQKDPALTVDILKLLKSRGFNGLNQRSHYGIYPFMEAILWRGILEDELLQYLTEEGVTVDFNAKDNEGDSVLFYALDLRFSAANLSFVKKLLGFGADPNHRNFDGQNAGHSVILCCHKYKCKDGVVLDSKDELEVEDPVVILNILKLLESNGFKGFNEKDSNGDTPLTLAIFKNISDDKLLNFLRERTLE